MEGSNYSVYGYKTQISYLITDLGNDSFLHCDVSSTEYHFFSYLNTFYTPKTFRSKDEVESTFKDFLPLKTLGDLSK